LISFQASFPYCFIFSGVASERLDYSFTAFPVEVLRVHQHKDFPGEFFFLERVPPYTAGTFFSGEFRLPLLPTNFDSGKSFAQFFFPKCAPFPAASSLKTPPPPPPYALSPKSFPPPLFNVGWIPLPSFRQQACSPKDSSQEFHFFLALRWPEKVRNAPSFHLSDAVPFPYTLSPCHGEPLLGRFFCVGHSKDPFPPVVFFK